MVRKERKAKTATTKNILKNVRAFGKKSIFRVIAKCNCCLCRRKNGAQQHQHTHIHTQHTCQKIVKRNRQKLLRWPWDRHESTTDDDDCSPSRQLFNLQAKGSLPYAALLPDFFITCTVNYWHNKCGGSYNNINWWRQQYTHQPQSEPHSHTHRHTCEGNTVEGRKGEMIHAKLLTLTCGNKRAAHSPQSKAKNMKLAYNFRRCPFCFVHQLTDKWQNGMNETASLPHEFWSNGMRWHTHTHSHI